MEIGLLNVECILDKMDFRAIDTPKRNPLRYSYCHRGQKKQKIFFEMVGATSKDVGSLKEVMDAAFRGKCSYLNVYAKDVLKGTKGFPEYDNTYEEAS
ncbi:hypothetical protein NXX53_09150 [Bacteroides salyersiae]|nr:hypothetical protein [Bacteroides salyersiae]